MGIDRSAATGAVDDEDLSEFLGLLREFKSTGCSLLVVGDVPRGLLARASADLLGAADAVRYRLLAVTDADAARVADRLPDPADQPRSLAETTRVLECGGTARSAAATATDGAASADAAPSTDRGPLVPVRSAPSLDDDLDSLRSAVEDGVDAVLDGEEIRPGWLRVGVDSLAPLVDRHGPAAVADPVEALGDLADDRAAMVHFVLPASYGDDAVRTLTPAVDAVIELRSVDAPADDHDGEQRWHVPDRDLTMPWTPL